MQDLFDEVNRKMQPYIRNVAQTVISATGEFDHFIIRH